jgi:hypothetical protein
MLPFSAPFAENIGDIRRISKIYLRMFSGGFISNAERYKITFLANSASPATMGSPAIAG